ncbi:GH36-type glycosyl hydrolase domain-containing protein [Spirochaeta dissipatitropha]
MKWELNEQGFCLHEPQRLRPWYNYMSNASYGMKLSHLGDGYAETIVEPRLRITHSDPLSALKGRYVYVREAQAPAPAGAPATAAATAQAAPIVWNPSFRPAQTPLDGYECRHEAGITIISGRKNGIQVTSSHAVPLEGSFELWHIRVVNQSSEQRSLQLFTQTEMLLNPTADVSPVYFSWFTNSRYSAEERTIHYFRTDLNPVCGFCTSLVEPDGMDSSLREWCGDGDMSDPQSVRDGRARNSISAGDPSIGSFQYDLDLEAGAERCYAIILGPGSPEAALQRFSSPAHVEEELQRLQEDWRRKLDLPQLQNLPEGIFASYARSFLGYQVLQQSTGIVREGFRGYRDVAQDAIGLVYYDPAGARKLIIDLCRNQHDTGRPVRQWSVDGSHHDERDFRDLAFWLPIAIARYLDAGGDIALLQVDVPFLESGSSAPVWEHVRRGVEFSLQYGPHGLLKIGIGDWNDALSGLGLEGESLWLNQFAYYACAALERIEQLSGVNFGIDLDAERECLYAGVQQHWTGSWFARGFHEDGTMIGGKERIFLLPQAWFTISGMAERDPERGTAALDAMIAGLDHDHGLLICNPGFEEYDAHVGNLSCLAPGMAENYAVYNHASAYGIYALFQAGRNEDALRYLRRLLPFYQDAERSGSEPFVLVNFYNGGAVESKKGRGGIPWLTGTVHWLAMMLFEFIIPQKIEV